MVSAARPPVATSCREPEVQHAIKRSAHGGHIGGGSGASRQAVRVALRVTVTVSVGLGAVGCGGDDRDAAIKTVTVPARTVTVTTTAPAASDPAPSATAAAESVGPPLPAGVVGIDGRYLLQAVSSDYEGQDSGDRFFSYEEPSSAATKCGEDRCSVTFRLGVKSGGSKTYILRADPEREGTYVGTGSGPGTCVYRDRVVPSRERIAVRGGSVQDIDGRQVAGRLGVYITTTARCDGRVQPDTPAKSVVTLRGPRQR